MSMPTNTKQKDSKGFTIVELLIVIVVIGILAAITIVAFNGVQTKARDSERAAEVKSLQTALEMYKAENDVYPLHAGGSDNSGYQMIALESLLVPKYLAALPREPNSTATYQYVRDTGGLGYGIRVQYESKPNCHAGVNNQTRGWWSVGAC